MEAIKTFELNEIGGDVVASFSLLEVTSTFIAASISSVGVTAGAVFLIREASSNLEGYPS